MNRRLTVLETRFDTMLPTLATKEDMAVLRAEMENQGSLLRLEMEKQGNHLRLEMEKEGSHLRLEMEKEGNHLRLEMEKQRTELLVEMHKLRADFERLVSKGLNWLMSLTITLVLGLAGVGMTLFNSLKNHPAIAPATAAAPGRAVTPPIDAPLPPQNNLNER